MHRSHVITAQGDSAILSQLSFVNFLRCRQCRSWSVSCAVDEHSFRYWIAFLWQMDERCSSTSAIVRPNCIYYSVKYQYFYFNEIVWFAWFETIGPIFGFIEFFWNRMYIIMASLRTVYISLNCANTCRVLLSIIILVCMLWDGL